VSVAGFIARWWRRLMGARDVCRIQQESDLSTRCVVDDPPLPPLTVAVAPASAEKTPRRRLEPLRREIADIADDFIAAITERRYETNHAVQLQKETPWTQGLPHLVQCDFHLIHEFANAAELQRSEDGYFFATPNEMVETFWPIDFCMAAYKEDGDPEGVKEPAFFVARVASVDREQVRGRVKIVPRYIVHVSSCYFYVGDHPLYAENTLVGLINNRWQIIEREEGRVRNAGGYRGDTSTVMRYFSPSYRDEMARTVEVTFAGRLTHRYEWHVAFGDEPGARLVIPTSPRACLELFRDRDLRPGEDRRAALRHWVKEHWREKASDPDEIVYVCQHLRGNRLFTWKGFRCELLVSEFDLERNEFFRQQAAEWRAMRKHNRVRVRLKEWKSG
jgi:hypothetical protein